MSPLTRRYHVPSALRVSSARIDPDVARELLDRGALLVDVRREDDPAVSIAGAVRIPPDEIPADRYDRRRILFVFQGANMLLAAALAVLWATSSLTLPLLGALAVVGGILGTMSFPAFQGMLAATVPRRDLESAVALNSL